jgi:hypothetical protein
MRRKINPLTGCYCDTLAHRLTGDGCDMCNPKLAAELKREVAEEDAAERAKEGEG